MDYKVNDISSVKKEVSVTVEVDEVNAALGAAIAMYRRDAQIDGFRKGKVPSSVIESRYKKQIYPEATTDLVNYHINQIMGEVGVQPIGGIDFDGGELVRDETFEYKITFEVRPEFDMPEYEGLDVDMETSEVDPDEVEQVINRLRERLAEAKPIDEDRVAQSGDVVVVSFEALEDGKPMEGIRADNFEMTLGSKEALPEFEDIVCKMKTTDRREEDVTFPDDFLNPEMAGKTITMRVHLHAIKERILPEVSNELAQKAGGFRDVDHMRETIENSYLDQRKQLAKSNAQKKLLDSLLKIVDFELPESLVDQHIDRQVSEMVQRIESQGRSIDSLGKTPEQIREECRESAEELTRSQIFLMAVAERENIEVTDQDLDMFFARRAAQSGENANQLKRYYMEQNLLHGVRDALMADKAMDLIFDKANVTEVAPEAAEETTEDAAE